MTEQRKVYTLRKVEMEADPVLVTFVMTDRNDQPIFEIVKVVESDEVYVSEITNEGPQPYIKTEGTVTKIAKSLADRMWNLEAEFAKFASRFS